MAGLVKGISRHVEGLGSVAVCVRENGVLPSGRLVPESALPRLRGQANARWCVREVAFVGCKAALVHYVYVASQRRRST
jgi:hypothetical protein